MKSVNRNASASAFGWQFQINIAIYLMIKYFGKFKEMKIEGEKEDIEISLNNSRKIYAQAKSKQNINDGNTSSYPAKLKKALESLSDVNDSENFIYISNLEPNPLNSGTNEFELVSFLKYNELSLASRKKIDIQLDNIKSRIDKSKLIIAKVPFFGEDKETKQKYIIAKIEDFLTFINSDLLPYKNRFLEMWESEALHNATQSNMKLKIKKEDVLWRLLILKLGDGNSIKFDESMGIDEEDFFEALDRYDRIINYKEADFDVYNKISNLIVRAKNENKEIRSNQFIAKYEKEIYDIVFKDNKDENMETVEKACSKIIAKKIFIRKGTIFQMFERANKYED